MNREQEAAELQPKALVWAACIRSHGVPSFPDPVVTVKNGLLAVGMDLSHIDINGSVFQAALSACKRLPGALPAGTDHAAGGP